MVAIGVLLVAIMSAFSSQLTSLELMRTSRETQAALADLQAAMESILTLPVDGIPQEDDPYPPGQSIAAFEDLHLTDERIVPSYPGYPGGAAVPPDPLTIVLRMNWTDYGGRPRTLTLSSMKAK